MHSRPFVFARDLSMYTRRLENVVCAQKRPTAHCRLPELRLDPAVILLRQLGPVGRGFGLEPVEVVNLIPLIVGGVLVVG